MENFKISTTWHKCKPGGLNLSRSYLDWESRSRRCQRVHLDCREKFDKVKKCVSTVAKSRSRSRLLNFVSTSRSRTKSLNRDWEICQDLKISAFLNSHLLNVGWPQKTFSQALCLRCPQAIHKFCEKWKFQNIHNMTQMSLFVGVS